jgi:hypothetical protein
MPRTTFVYVLGDTKGHEACIRSLVKGNIKGHARVWMQDESEVVTERLALIDKAHEVWVVGQKTDHTLRDWVDRNHAVNNYKMMWYATTDGVPQTQEEAGYE